MAKKYVKKMLAEYSDKQNEVERIREAGRPERMRLLGSKKQLGLADWIEITGFGIGDETHYIISGKGIRFIEWKDDFIGSFPPREQENMVRQNEEPGLDFPCTPKVLLDFVDSGAGGFFDSFIIPDEFRKAVEEAACKPKEQAAPVASPSSTKRLTVWIGGREALPVRAIPYVTDWKLFSPDVVVKSLAYGEKWDFAPFPTLTAYHLSGNTPAPVSRREWEAPVTRLKGFEAKLNRLHNNQNEAPNAEEYDAWRRDAVATIFPDGSFVWLDEFEKEYRAYCSWYGRCNQPVDAELKLAPMLHADTRAMVMEGFPLPTISVGEHRAFKANVMDAIKANDGEEHQVQEELQVEVRYKIGWDDATMSAKFWLNEPDVEPKNAAMVLCRINPLNPEDSKDPENNCVDGDMSAPEKYLKLLTAFSSVSKTSPKYRTLMDWRAIAQQKGLCYHPWIEDYLATTGAKGETVQARLEAKATEQARIDAVAKVAEQIQRAQERIVLTAHVGNWDYWAAFACLTPREAACLLMELNPKKEIDFFKSCNDPQYVALAEWISDIGHAATREQDTKDKKLSPAQWIEWAQGKSYVVPQKFIEAVAEVERKARKQKTKTSTVKQSHTVAPVVTAVHDTIKDQPRKMKRAALIAMLSKEGFKNVKNIFRRSQPKDNGLHDAAKHKDHNYWYVDKARAWFVQEQGEPNIAKKPDDTIQNKKVEDYWPPAK